MNNRDKATMRNKARHIRKHSKLVECKESRIVDRTVQTRYGVGRLFTVDSNATCNTYDSVRYMIHVQLVNGLL